MKQRRVAVLRGGPDDERAISMQTGEAVRDALLAGDFQVVDIVATDDTTWLRDGYSRNPLSTLRDVDVVFNALHGMYGEGGPLQRILSLTQLPYTGARALAGAITMNKIAAKTFAQRLSLLTPRHFRVRREQVQEPYLLSLQIVRLFGPEFIVKPTSSGSSIAVMYADTPEALAAALVDVLTTYDDVLVEERIVGREVAVALVEGFRGEDLYSFPLLEVLPDESRIVYDTATKYSSKVRYQTPPRIAPHLQAEIVTAAKALFRQLGLSQYALLEFIVNDHGIHFIEANALPGLTPFSVFPRVTGEVGATFPQLMWHIVDTARR